MTQRSELEHCVLQAVREYPDGCSTSDIATLIDMPNTDVVLQFLERLAEEKLIRNTDDRNGMGIRSIWRPL